MKGVHFRSQERSECVQFRYSKLDWPLPSGAKSKNVVVNLRSDKTDAMSKKAHRQFEFGVSPIQNS